MSDKKAPNDIDRLVGARVRMFRTMTSMSQEKLGEALGVTFQQVQKYEKGTNRISASRLRQIAETLGVTIGDLYGSGSGGGETGFAEDAAPYQHDMLTGEALKLLRAFHRIGDLRLQRKLAEIAEILAAGADESNARSS